MESVIVFILISYGITAILTQSYLFEFYRNYFKNEWIRYLTRCTQCTGFWLGLLVSLIYNIQSTIEMNVLLSMFIHGTISSGACYIIQSLIDSIGNISKKEETIKFNLDEAEESNE